MSPKTGASHDVPLAPLNDAFAVQRVAVRIRRLSATPNPARRRVPSSFDAGSGDERRPMTGLGGIVGPTPLEEVRFASVESSKPRGDVDAAGTAASTSSTRSMLCCRTWGSRPRAPSSRRCEAMCSDRPPSSGRTRRSEARAAAGPSTKRLSSKGRRRATTRFAKSR
jgi:hypothetical protein